MCCFNGFVLVLLCGCGFLVSCFGGLVVLFNACFVFGYVLSVGGVLVLGCLFWCGFGCCLRCCDFVLCCDAVVCCFVYCEFVGFVCLLDVLCWLSCLLLCRNAFDCTDCYCL